MQHNTQRKHFDTEKMVNYFSASFRDFLTLILDLKTSPEQPN